jgi:hypothetical protein
MWYKREEQAVLNSIWYCMTGVQLIVNSHTITPFFELNANKLRSEVF